MDSQVRITQSGKLKAWVSYSLEFLSKNEDIPLVLHTLSPPLAKSAESSDKTKPADKEKSSLSTATKTIPRLISTIEIIKREFVKSLEEQHSTRLVGLHQYNEIGCLEDLEGYKSPIANEETRSAAIARALEGKNHPKQVQTPYMKVTLSLCELPELVVKGATYQPPIARQLSKGQKSRAKKKLKKSTTAAPTDADKDASQLAPSTVPPP